jgi:hypothetical protein
VQDITANLTLLLFDDYNYQHEKCGAARPHARTHAVV